MNEKNPASELKSVLDAFFDSRQDAFRGAAEAIAEAVREGHQVLVFGNGGSAAEAQHFAAELVNRFLAERRAIPAVALSTDASTLTAVADGEGFEKTFARQVERLGRPGDVAVALSTSGESANVIEGLKAARRKGLITVALTGDGGGGISRPGGSRPDYLLDVPSRSTPRVQEIHLVLLHLLAGEIEKQVL
jgi:D-sedoheptulose 7-phosphate isomerase